MFHFYCELLGGCKLGSKSNPKHHQPDTHHFFLLNLPAKVYDFDIKNMAYRNRGCVVFVFDHWNTTNIQKNSTSCVKATIFCTPKDLRQEVIFCTESSWCQPHSSKVSKPIAFFFAQGARFGGEKIWKAATGIIGFVFLSFFVCIKSVGGTSQ